eukprot:CAMPEP_0116880908 /NCGR_PEP_ID=MMETSP0463-20121206/12944_1 /TAXON_ID=181622 /ORGANISM="Strombidinopsis sp, Strain SopsisLIS2011" /LENGTH=64 /DNA_ID=CAMNT_0004532171 /DNA_START=464 /DNA_END=658 /DNA_ORIENTATION=-
MNEQMAQELIKMANNDEVTNYERNEDFTRQSYEQTAQLFDPNNNEVYICPLCKNYIYRVDATRV